MGKYEVCWTKIRLNAYDSLLNLGHKQGCAANHLKALNLPLVYIKLVNALVIVLEHTALRSFTFNTIRRRCFSFFDILVYLYVHKWGKKKKLNPTMAFRDSQLASAANSAKIWSDRPCSAALISKLSMIALLGFQFFSFPNLGHISGPKYQKIRSIFFKRY